MPFGLKKLFSLIGMGGAAIGASEVYDDAVHPENKVIDKMEFPDGQTAPKRSLWQRLFGDKPSEDVQNLESIRNQTGKIIRDNTTQKTGTVITMLNPDDPNDSMVIDGLRSQAFAANSNAHGLKIRVAEIWKVHNPHLASKFKRTLNRKTSIRLVYHGTSKDNAFSIARNGFKLPNHRNGMLGRAVYSTRVFSKALTAPVGAAINGEAYVVVCLVSIGGGEPLVVDNPNNYKISKVESGESKRDTVEMVGSKWTVDAGKNYPQATCNYSELASYKPVKVCPVYIMRVIIG